MVLVDNKTIIYVVAPACKATGGPELLHQLVHSLRDVNVNAYMHYLPADSNFPVHSDYTSYNNPFVTTIEDEINNIIIVPEDVKYIEYLYKFKNIQKIIWWLSVDNYYKTMFKKKSKRSILMRLTNLIACLVGGGKRYDLAEEALKFYRNYELVKNNDISTVKLHLVQSHYAYSHLLEKGVPLDNIKYLSDYLNDHFFGFDYKNHLDKKENIVLFNPKKGFIYTRILMSKMKHVQFIPIQKMTREDVIALMKKAKVYIDFGNHPGKDRMTREAVVLGCVIITSKKGSAGYYEDVPIPEEYKFEDNIENIPNIVQIIEDCLANYSNHIDCFCNYREKISIEKQEFYQNLKEVFRSVAC